jgi:hypothetical protein
MMSEALPTSAADLVGTPAPAAAPAPEAAAAPAAPEAAAPAATDTKPEAAETAAEPAIKLPGKDATAEEWAAFYKSIGAPETADAYKLPVPEGDDGAFAKTAAEWFKDSGVLPQQAEKLAGKWNEFVTAQIAESEKAEADRIAALNAKNVAEKQELTNEWGAKATENIEFAKRAAVQFFPKENAANVISAIEGVLGYKATIQMLHNIGKGLGEHDATAGMGAQTGGLPQKSLAERMFKNMPN